MDSYSYLSQTIMIASLFAETFRRDVSIYVLFSNMALSFPPTVKEESVPFAVQYRGGTVATFSAFENQNPYNLFDWSWVSNETWFGRLEGSVATASQVHCKSRTKYAFWVPCNTAKWVAQQVPQGASAMVDIHTDEHWPTPLHPKVGLANTCALHLHIITC